MDYEKQFIGSFEEAVLAQAKELIAKVEARDEPKMGVIMVGITEPTPYSAHTIHAGLVEPCGNFDEAHVLAHKIELMQTALDSLQAQVTDDMRRLLLLKMPTPSDPSKGH